MSRMRVVAVDPVGRSPLEATPWRSLRVVAVEPMNLRQPVYQRGVIGIALHLADA